ncbi:fimbrial biogenesis chaperone [Pseudocitrobacter cyperus]|uniref:Molecular chaperone n=1 Tax=Pseudocitrobacter cyperus TaxID=3112843 RepID=A0ABV0HHD8_9ENTR
MKYVIIFLTLIITSFSSLANVIISNTRVIYPEDQKETTVQLINRGTSPALIQAWLDENDPNSTPETAQVPFLLTPPVVKIEGDSGQQLRIRFTGAAGSLPQNKESVYYLNVLDIPPKQENLDGKNLMQIAIKSRIKVFYRPANLKIAVSDLHTYLSFNAQGNQLIASNNAPYFASIATISAHGKALIREPVMIAPFSTLTIGTTEPVSGGQALDILLVDDYGSYQKYSLTTK